MSESNSAEKPLRLTFPVKTWGAIIVALVLHSATVAWIIQGWKKDVETKIVQINTELVSIKNAATDSKSLAAQNDSRQDTEIAKVSSQITTFQNTMQSWMIQMSTDIGIIKGQLSSLGSKQ